MEANVSNGSSGKWARGAIRIFSDTMMPDTITQKLGLQPTEVYEKGARAQTRSSHPATWVTSVWLMDSGLPKASALEAHVESLLGKLEAHEEALREIAHDNPVELFLGFSAANGQGGFTFEHDLLVRLAQLPIDITLDLHPPDR